MASEQQTLPMRPRIAGAGLLTAAAWTLVCLLAAGFIYKYVVHYYLHFDAKSFDVYWPRRTGLLAHVTAGTAALALGPLQFWTGLKAMLPRLHRWTGRLYLLAVAVGAAAGLYMAATTTFGWPFGLGLAMLDVAWISTTAVAYVAILNGAVALHRRWVVRSYVVTFAFVIFRLVQDWLPTSQIKPPQDLAVADAWGCWVIPLMITIVIQELRDIRRHGRRRPARA